MKNTCPVNKLFSEIGKMWILQILREISLGNHRFNNLKNNLGNISSKTLSLKLKELQLTDFIEKKTTSLDPVIVEYHLTDKGKSFEESCEFLGQWATKWGY